MYPFRFFKFLKFAVCIVAAAALFGYVVERLWNWLMPSLFNLHAITYWQAIGLIVLSKLLFGGFHRHGHGGRGQRRWKKKMQERWSHMTPEERERFRAGIKSRWGRGYCGFDPRPDFDTPADPRPAAQPFTR